MDWNLPFAESVLELIGIISVTDAEGKYVFANSSWLRTYNLSLEETCQLYPWEIVPGTMVRTVINTQQPVLGHTVEFQGKYAFVSYFPIFREGVFDGVLILSETPESEYTKKLVHLLLNMEKQIQSAKHKLNMLNSAKYSLSNIIGDSLPIKKLRQNILSAAKTRSTVLLEGETGAGKELVANAIHDLSSRNTSPFLRVNCSAIPAELMESEFFGYEEGTFTGAKKGGKRGKFEIANGGSLFLDEINQLPFIMQPKFLRVLQEQEVERIGGKKSISLDIRFIAATNQSLRELVKKGKFREDLYYRLDVIRIQIPPLRERKEDIPLLSRHLLKKLNHHLGMDIGYIDPKVFKLFKQYHWPGNIRELQNVLERAMCRATEDCLEISHFDSFQQQENTTSSESPRLLTSAQSFKNRIYEEEKKVVLNILAQTNWNKTETARLLGISRTALYKRLKKYHI